MTGRLAHLMPAEPAPADVRLNDRRIYGLHDDLGRVRYVGQTWQRLPLRLKEHWYTRTSSHHLRAMPLARWLATLDAPPSISALETVPRPMAVAAEHEWIHLLRAAGCDLLNLKPQYLTDIGSYVK